MSVASMQQRTERFGEDVRAIGFDETCEAFRIGFAITGDLARRMLADGSTVTSEGLCDFFTHAHERVDPATDAYTFVRTIAAATAADIIGLAYEVNNSAATADECDRATADFYRLYAGYVLSIWPELQHVVLKLTSLG